MGKNSSIKTAVIVALCIFFNVGGKLIAEMLRLPVWMDSFGTALTAYAYGPICGAVVGFSGNIICGLRDGYSYIYSVTSIAIGLALGVMAQRKNFDTIFGTMTASVVATISSVVISVPLNIIFFDGYTNNRWGDGVIGFLKERNFPGPICNLAGEFYVDFLDKVITLLLLYVVVEIGNGIRKHRKKKKKETPEDVAETVVPAILITAVCAMVFSKTYALAEDDDAWNFNSYVCTVYSNENGLPSGEANDIVQTKDGILWIGTYAGLYRYNGSEFRWMDYESVRNVNALYTDEEGRLWIGTNDNGLSICIQESITNVVDREDGLPSDSVRCITQASDGHYYIGTTDSLAVMALNNGLSMVGVIPQVHYAVSLTADEEGHVVAVTSEGKMFLLGNDEILATREPSSADEIFTCASFQGDGLLYVGTSANNVMVYQVSGNGFTRQKVIDCGEIKSIQSIEYAEDGTAFICADNGVGYLDKKEVFHSINTREFNNSIDSMVIDYQGNLWFASSRLGLMRLSPSVFTDVYRTYGLDNKVVNSVEEWRGKLYFGTDSGLDVVDMNSQRPVENELTEMLDGIRIRCVRKDSRNNLWICSYGKGLIKVLSDGSYVMYDGSNGAFGNRVRTVLELSDGTIVAAGDTGISFIGSVGIQKTIHYGENLSNALILSLLETKDGALLAGTDGDGIALIRDGEVVRNLTKYEGLSSGVILRLMQCSDNEHILIVTSNGLCCMDSNYNISVLSNFPYFNNYDAWTGFGGKLYIPSSAGLYIAAEADVINDIENMNYDLLDTKSGLCASLTANSWNYMDDAGNLYLSTDTGVYMLDTVSFAKEKNSYRMQVSSVRLDGAMAPVERGEAIHVNRGVSKIEIFPEVINYTIEDPYVRYFMAGFDTAPTIVNQSELSTVTYTNLPSGTYTFFIAVLDKNTMDVLEQSSYVFEKDKEIYDNRWFRTYMFIVAIIAVAWFTWFVAKTQVQRTLDLQRKQLELAERQVQMGNETILAIAKTVDAKDENTSQHSLRVSEYSVLIARELGFDEEECENLRKAALLHDIGKIGIPDRILNKPDRLDDKEYEIMKSHVTRGAEILKDFTLVKNVVDGALYHHERYDGTGYMSGKKGADIPIYGRIIGVADAFDAMTANRVYRKKLDLQHVLQELRNGRGTQFDPEITDIMLRLIRDGKIDVKSIYGEEVESE